MPEQNPPKARVVKNAPAQNPDDPYIGRTMLDGGLMILRSLGSGGMGEVYQVRVRKDVIPGVPIDSLLAVKFFDGRRIDRRQNPEYRKRFRREARIAAKLKNPYITQTYDLVHDDGLDYYVMEFLNQMVNLSKLGPTQPTNVVTLINRQIGDALGYLHEEGIIHRDVKPSNIILAEDPNGAIPIEIDGKTMQTTAKLCDLGLLKLLEMSPMEGDDGVLPTGTGTALGTPHFMAPEQARGKTVTHKTDIYSLGATSYKILTGRRPFDGDSVLDVMELLARAVPPPIGTGHPLLQKVILMQMAKAPENRPELEEMVQILDVVDGRKKEKELPLDLRNRMENDIIHQNLQYVSSSQLPLTQQETITMTPAVKDTEEPKTPTPQRRKLYELKKPKKRGLKIGLGIGALMLTAAAGIAHYFVKESNYKQNLSDLESTVNRVAAEVRDDKDVDVKKIWAEANPMIGILNPDERGRFNNFFRDATKVRSIDRYLDAADTAITAGDYKKADQSIAAAQVQIDAVNPDNLEGRFQDRYKTLKTRKDKAVATIESKRKARTDFEAVNRNLDTASTTYTTLDTSLDSNKLIERQKIQDLLSDLSTANTSLEGITANSDALDPGKYDAARTRMQGLEAQAEALYRRNVQVAITLASNTYTPLDASLGNHQMVAEADIRQLQEKIKEATTRLASSKNDIGEEYSKLEASIGSLTEQAGQLPGRNLSVAIEGFKLAVRNRNVDGATEYLSRIPDQAAITRYVQLYNLQRQLASRDSLVTVTPEGLRKTDIDTYAAALRTYQGTESGENMKRVQGLLNALLQKGIQVGDLSDKLSAYQTTLVEQRAEGASEQMYAQLQSLVNQATTKLQKDGREMPDPLLNAQADTLRRDLYPQENVQQ